MKIRLNGVWFALCCAIVMAAPHVCWALDLNSFSGTGDWNETNKWDLLHLPSATEIARIGGVATLTNTPPIVGELRVYKALAISGNDTSVTGNLVTIGWNSGPNVTGQLTQVDGRFTSNGDFLIGNPSTGKSASGIVSFTGTEVVVATTKKLNIGFNIEAQYFGEYRHCGGTLSCGPMIIGAGASTGYANLDGITVAATSLTVADSGLGMCHMTGTVFSTGGTVTVGNNTNAVGTCGQLCIESSFLGRIPTTAITLGNAFGTTGIVSMSGGSVTGTVNVGYSGHGVFSNLAGRVYGNTFLVAAYGTNSSGYACLGPDSYTESTVNAQAGRFGNGTIDVYGTFATTNISSSALYVGNNASATGILNLYEGGVIISSTLYVGQTGTGTFHIVGGVAKVLTETFYMGTYIGSSGTVRLSGGRLEIYKVKPGAGTEIFHFDGGTLATSDSRTDFMGSLTTVDVLTGGAKIEVSHAITISQKITHDVADPTGLIKDGGLFKDGTETLKMTGALSFNGDLRVEAGTLDLTGATYTPGSDAGLGGGGTLIPKGGTFIVNGIVAPGTTNGTGTLTVQGQLTANGQTRITVAGDGETCGTLNVTGALVFGAGSTLAFANPAAFKKKTNYTFVTADTITGMPAVIGLPLAWTLKAEGNAIRAIYNAGTLIKML